MKHVLRDVLAAFVAAVLAALVIRVLNLYDASSPVGGATLTGPKLAIQPIAGDVPTAAGVRAPAAFFFLAIPAPLGKPP